MLIPTAACLLVNIFLYWTCFLPTVRCWTLERPVEPCRVVAFSSAQREKGLKYLLYVSLNWSKLYTLNYNGIIMGLSCIWLYAKNIRASSNFKHCRMLLFCIFVTVGSTCCWLFFPSHLQHSSSVLVCSSDLPSPVFIHLFFWVLQVCGRPSCSPDSSCCSGRLWGASRWLTWNSNDGRTLLWSLWRLLPGGSCDIQHSCAT